MSDEQKDHAKKSYHAPVLSHYGSIAEVTQNVHMGTGHDHPKGGGSKTS